MTVRVPVAASVLRWAQGRSGSTRQHLLEQFPQLVAWESGERQPTLKQLESFARKTHTSVGYLLLSEPPVDDLPIPDFRTIRDTGVTGPSPNLLDTIYLCEHRQEWYRTYAERHGIDAVGVVGSHEIGDDIAEVSADMRDTLGFSFDERAQYRTWAEALRGLIEAAEDVGILVMISGIVGSNTHRPLDPKEFRGFALVDDYAPLVFINGADTKAAQIFTLTHELVHIWAGQSGVDKPELDGSGEMDEERWCNGVAAEFLVPSNTLPTQFAGPTLTDDLDRLARQYKVSTLVVLRRLYDSGRFGWDDFRSAYVDELARVMDLARRASTGGNFYYTQPYRVSRRFARALIANTLEGETLHRDAFRLLGVRKLSTFQEFGEHVGVA